ncbi:glutaminase A [Microaerobacter geothermalis]|uniref:glutaminase A n=1 Tax=Microaerobacter geothermalis TaxID=674972 RepID=UPI0038B2B405
MDNEIVKGMSSMLQVLTKQKRLKQWINEIQPISKKGRLATYIPQLGTANPDALGIVICPLDGDVLAEGNTSTPFTLQSISKVITLALALMDHGPDKVFSHVGMEPTGDPFNSIVKLEMMKPSKPLNPMINAGAIAVSSLIKGKNADEKFERILDLTRKLLNNPGITYSEDVYWSEWETGDRNRALAYFMRETKVIEGDVEEIVSLYFKHCSIEVTCFDLAQLGYVLANYGRNQRGEQLMPADVTRVVHSFMVTCGMYNGSGEFAIKVGIPAKSGVAGGILASVPQKMGIGVYGPALNEKGNSICGVLLLQKLSEAWNLSIF